jgi:acetylornithine deacetylase/succinyl-diaminopimelate desuccinylase-like protein
MIHMSTIFDAIKENNLKYNISFLIEGDEETSGADFDACIKKHRSLLHANLAIISDGEMANIDTPTMSISYR